MKGFLFLPLLALFATPSNAQNIEIRQLDYFDKGALIVPFSEWGLFEFEYPPGPDLMWLNVIAEPGLNDRWIVQNMPLLSVTDAPEPLHAGCMYFDLGVPRGTDILDQPYPLEFTVTPQPLVNPPLFGNPFVAQVGHAQSIINSGVPSGLNLLNFPTPFLLPWVPVVPNFKSVFYNGMPNVVQETNFCGPGAAANSLHWLYPNLGQTVAQTQTELAGNMGNANNGNWDDTEVAGKLKFTKDHNLPVEVHYAGGRMLPTMGNYTPPGNVGTARNDGAFDCDWLTTQLCNGQDVEIMTNTHWVVVSGIVRWGDVCMIEFRDDPFQDGAATTPAQQAELAKRYTWTHFDASDGSINIGNGREPLQTAVAESPLPPFWFLGLDLRNGLFFGSNPTGFLSGFTPLDPNPLFIPAMDFDAFETTLWGINAITTEYGTFDPLTGTFFPIGLTGLSGVTGLTAAPDGVTWYVSTSNGIGSDLYVGDITTGIFVFVGPILANGQIIDISMDSQGNLFGNNISDDSLYNIDTVIGVGTLIGPTGQPTDLAQGMDFDWGTDTLYATLYTGGGTGVFATIDVNTGLATVLENTGPLDAAMVIAVRASEVIGVNYCGPAVPNSTGLPAEIFAVGSDVALDNNLTLHCVNMPLNQFGYFLNGTATDFVMNPAGSQGHLCLGGSIGRYNRDVTEILFSGLSGAISLQLDLNNTPTPTVSVAIVAGETWYFQCWHRDLNPNTASNFSDGLQIAFQ